MAGTLTSTRKITNTAGSQPVLTTSAQINIPKICITLDHLGENQALTSLQIAQQLKIAQIPVTVFVFCSGSKNPCASEVLDTETAKQKIFSNPNLEHRCSEKQWKMLKDLHAMGVTLGIHTLATKATQAEPVIPSKATQTANIDYLRFVIYLITGNYPNVASYHGSGADPHPNIDLNGKGIDFVRGVGQIDLGKYNTPIQANTLSSLDKLDGVRVNTFFFHSNEVAVESPAKQVYNALIVGVKAKKYQAINYYQAMRANYG